MGPIPFAFSVSHFINSVGADAGFASIIGLAILVLLYFAQARETASLREQAYEAAQRVQQLESRLSQYGRPPAGAQASSGEATLPPQAAPPARAPASLAAAVAAAGTRSPAPVPAPAPVLASAPVAPAGVGAPALTAATRLIPDPLALARGGGGSVAVGERPVDHTAIGGPPPATVAGGANGTTAAPPPHAASPSAPAAPPARVQIRSGATAGGAPRRPVAPPRGPVGRRRPPRGRRLLAAALVGLVVAAIVVVLLMLTSSGGNSSNPQAASTPTPVTNAPVTHRRARSGPAPSSITVAVLNGTGTSGLAHRVAVKLGGTGFKQGTVATATDQTRTATIVGYLPGHRRDAMLVASSLKLGPASVSAVDQGTQAVACPPPGACSATIVVTVGSDLSSTP